MTTAPSRTPQAAGQAKADPLQLIDVDHVRFYCGNAKQAATFYAATYGFNVEQIADLTTGSRDAAQYLITQGNIRFVLTSGLTKDHPASRHVMLYGDGVKDVAFTVHDAAAAHARAGRNGAEWAYEPTELRDEHGTVVMAGIKTYGECIHSFVSRSGGYALPSVKQGGRFLPRFGAVGAFSWDEYNRQHPCGLKFLDHLVGNVELGKMNYWVAWYESVLEFKLFKTFDDKDISTDFSALMSKVMPSGRQLIKLRISEPAPGKKKSQVQEYLDWHNQTPGVQHLALRTDDELASIAELRRRGVDFLAIPEAYYDKVWERVEGTLKQHGKGDVKEDHRRGKEVGILVDAGGEV